MQLGAWLMAVSAPVVGVRGEVGKAAGDKWGLPGGPGCGKYMESDEEMNVRMLNQRRVRTAGFREAGKTLHLLPSL